MSGFGVCSVLVGSSARSYADGSRAYREYEERVGVVVRRHGMKWTLARVLLVRALATSATPLTRVELRARLLGEGVDIPRAQVAKNLARFVEMGIVAVIPPGDRYVPRFASLGEAAFVLVRGASGAVRDEALEDGRRVVLDPSRSARSIMVLIDV